VAIIREPHRGCSTWSHSELRSEIPQGRW